MALINTLRKQVDLPSWETLRMSPSSSSATSGTCAPDNGITHPDFTRYIYYLISATQFMRYDTVADTYMGLASPPIAQNVCSKLYFSGATGFEGRVLSANATTFTAPAFTGKRLKGYDVRIISGTGVGQQRYISDVADPIVADTGVATGATALVLTDSTKAWTINQWAGYQLRITYGSGISQVRKILYSDATSLTFTDVNRMAIDYNANPQPPSPAFSATAGVQSVYQIESSVVTIDSAWAVTPDATSRFRIMSGTVTLVTGYSTAATAPYYVIQIYDILSDTWYIRTAPTNTLLSAAATDLMIQRTPENASVWAKGISNLVTSSGATLTNSTTNIADASQNWPVNSLVGKWIRIYSGTGENQLRQISANTLNTITWVTTGTAPDITSRYLVSGFDAGVATSGTTQILTDSTKSWAVNRWKNYALRITSGTGKGYVAPILSNTATAITLIEPCPYTLDNTSQYEIQGDAQNIYISAGTQAAVMIHSIDADMTTFGRVNDYGLARNGSAQYGGFAPIPVASTSGTTTQTVTTSIAHGFQTGWSIKHMGDTSASAVYNNITATITVLTATTYTYPAPTSAAAWTVLTQSTGTLTDASKTWVVNEHANKICYFLSTAAAVGTGIATMLAMEIASNTANTLTFKTAVGTAPTTGVSRYIIATRSAVSAIASGIATGSQSTTTLQDTTQVATFTGSVSGYVMTSASGITNVLVPGLALTGTGITAGTTILYQLTGTTGGIGTYQVSASSPSTGSITITTGWVVNAYAGRRLRYLSGAGQSIELTILSNTNNTLTWATAGTSPTSASTSYAILGGSTKGAGLSGCWTFGTTDTSKAGKFIMFTRGGGVLGFDKLDLTTDLFELMSTSPQTETLTTGSMSAYDGGNRWYFTKEVTLRNYYLDLDTYQVHGAGLTAYTSGTAILGDRMEIFTTVPDGLKYLWTQRHSAQDAFRQLIVY